MIIFHVQCISTAESEPTVPFLKSKHTAHKISLPQLCGDGGEIYKCCHICKSDPTPVPQDLEQLGAALERAASALIVSCFSVASAEPQYPRKRELQQVL